MEIGIYLKYNLYSYLIVSIAEWSTAVHFMHLCSKTFMECLLIVLWLLLDEALIIPGTIFELIWISHLFPVVFNDFLDSFRINESNCLFIFSVFVSLSLEGFPIIFDLLVQFANCFFCESPIVDLIIFFMTFDNLELNCSLRRLVDANLVTNYIQEIFYGYALTAIKIVQFEEFFILLLESQFTIKSVRLLENSIT